MGQVQILTQWFSVGHGDTLCKHSMGRQTPEALLQLKTYLVYGTWTEMEAVHPTYPPQTRAHM